MIASTPWARHRSSAGTAPSASRAQRVRPDRQRVRAGRRRARRTRPRRMSCSRPRGGPGRRRPRPADAAASRIDAGSRRGRPPARSRRPGSAAGGSNAAPLSSTVSDRNRSEVGHVLPDRRRRDRRAPARRRRSARTTRHQIRVGRRPRHRPRRAGWPRAQCTPQGSRSRLRHASTPPSRRTDDEVDAVERRDAVDAIRMEPAARCRRRLGDRRPPSGARAARCPRSNRTGSRQRVLGLHRGVARGSLGGRPQRAVLALEARVGLVPEAARVPLPRPSGADADHPTRPSELRARRRRRTPRRGRVSRPADRAADRRRRRTTPRTMRRRCPTAMRSPTRQARGRSSTSGARCRVDQVLVQIRVDESRHASRRTAFGRSRPRAIAVVAGDTSITASPSSQLADGERRDAERVALHEQRHSDVVTVGAAAGRGGPHERRAARRAR